MPTRHHSGPRMSQIVEHENTIYVAGQVATDRTRPVGPQTLETLNKIEALLAEVGASRSDLLSMVVYISHSGDFAAMNEVYDSWVDKNNLPVRTCVEARLAHADVRVEITAVAARRG